MTRQNPSPQIIEVEIEDRGDYLCVCPRWDADTDRKAIGGISVGRNAVLGERLKKAMLAGVIYRDSEVRTDVNGKTYVSATCTVLSRILNAELNRLGF